MGISLNMRCEMMLTESEQWHVSLKSFSPIHIIRGFNGVFGNLSTNRRLGCLGCKIQNKGIPTCELSART